MFFFRVCNEYDGSFLTAFKSLQEAFMAGESIVWKIAAVPNATAIQILAGFALLQLLLWVIVPGRWWLACITPAGLRPSYKLNGPACYWMTLGLLYTSAHFKVFNPAIVWDNFPQMITFLCVFSYAFCFVLYFKGLYFPSSADSGTTGGGFVRDFFWGTELHPSFMGYYAKQYVNCRLSMTGWIVLMWCFAYKQYDIYGKVSDAMLVSVALQTLYIGKFFLWEHGYFNSIDIMHDRFGYYIFWGVMVFVPGFYTSVPMYLVKQPIEMGRESALLLFAAGLVCLYLNYAADEQRLRFRETGGKTTFFGKKPEWIVAKYTTSDGKSHESLLLTSGYWGFSRHFNYVGEIATALCWSLPAGFHHLLPYLYVIFLTLLLLHRLFRDETRCQLKYGEYYEQYKKKVPYYLVPYLF